jgi:3-oxoacyl-[acyl-carrier protein] reductase
MFDLTGKNALVTGAAGGIGRAVASALHAQGATLALSDLNVEGLEQLAADLGDRTHVVPCNLSDLEAVDKLPKEAEAAMGGLDILINNAGITRDNLFMRMKDEEWDSVIGINLTACFRLSKAAIRGMMKRRYGRIVSISSVVGATGNAGQANYAAAKAGLVGMTKVLAQEVASRNITANCVAPGFIATPMTEGLADDQKQALLAKIPAGKLGTAAEVASGVLFLASEESGYITGQTLHVNGGMAMI